MKSICVLGAFGYDANKLDGQTVKTRNVWQLLQKNYEGKIYRVDTLHVRKKPLTILLLFWYLIRCKTCIVIPCLNNLTFLFPIIYYLSKVLCYDIIHICIGGWQVEYFMGDERFKAHPLQLRQSKRIKAFMPEMVSVDNELKTKLGFTNTRMFPNFRFMILDTERRETVDDTLRLVFLARIDKKKGYDTIFKFVELIEKNNYNIKVDFYGPINESDKEEYLSLVCRHDKYVSYKGVLQQNEVTDYLVNYDVMLLPTTIFTEGFPGTILDAYMAGIPVIATEWKYSREFIDDKRTGFIVPFGECQSEFNERILTLYNDRELLSQMKNNAFCKRLNYSDQFAWSILSKYL